MNDTDPAAAHQPEIRGILLAAGQSQRFGHSNKLLQPLSSGLPMITQAVRTMLTALDSVVVVVPPEHGALAKTLKDEAVQITINPVADDGMGSSLAWGVTATIEAHGWIIGLADMPWIQPATISRVMTALRHGHPLVAPRYRSLRGHPVGFGREYRDTLLKLRGDVGARTVLKQHKAQLHYLEVNDPGILMDVDRPADLKPPKMFNA
ncbi:MAG: nucleotidyltransferase family protein [Halobacteria archaeon]|nr:nucleotidyltransferase family protein [Halobacteria archaeon]